MSVHAVVSIKPFFGLFALLGQPVIELLPRTLGQVDEAQAGAARVIRPRDLYFRFKRGGIPGQLEIRRDTAQGVLAPEKDGHAAFADIGHGRLQFLTASTRKRGGYFHGVPEIPRRSRIVKLTPALRQRLAFRAEIGFCRTKFAPSEMPAVWWYFHSGWQK